MPKTTIVWKLAVHGVAPFAGRDVEGGHRRHLGERTGLFETPLRERLVNRDEFVLPADHHEIAAQAAMHDHGTLGQCLVKPELKGHHDRRERDAGDGGGEPEGVAAQLEPGERSAQRKPSPPEPRGSRPHRAIWTSTSWLLRWATRFASAGVSAMRAFDDAAIRRRVGTDRYGRRGAQKRRHIGDRAGQLARERVARDRRRGAEPHPRDVGIVDIRLDVHCVGGSEGQHRRAGQLTRLEQRVEHDPGDRGAQQRLLDLRLGARQSGAGKCDLALGVRHINRADLGNRGGPVPGFVQRPFRHGEAPLRRLQIGAGAAVCLEQGLRPGVGQPLVIHLGLALSDACAERGDVIGLGAGARLGERGFRNLHLRGGGGDVRRCRPVIAQHRENLSGLHPVAAVNPEFGHDAWPATQRVRSPDLDNTVARNQMAKARDAGGRRDRAGRRCFLARAGQKNRGERQHRSPMGQH